MSDDQIDGFNAWAEAVLKVVGVSGMSEEQVIPTWPEGVNGPALTVGMVRAAHARYSVPDDTLRDAFISGFRYCAVNWADRDDLYSYVHSEAFRKGMESRIKRIITAAQQGGDES